LEALLNNPTIANQIDFPDSAGKHSVKLALENYGLRVESYQQNTIVSQIAINMYGSKIVGWAQRNNPFKALRILMYARADKINDYFFWAATNGYVAIIRTLIDDEKVNSENLLDSHGKTGLMIACENNKIGAVTVLTQKPLCTGIRTRDVFNKTALDYAIASDNQEIINRVQQKIAELANHELSEISPSIEESSLIKRKMI
jgi:hypothetical protein